jgi:hypothetical protein
MDNVIRLHPPLTYDAIVDFVRKNEPVSTDEIARRYGWDGTTARGYLFKLRRDGRLFSKWGRFVHTGGGGHCTIWSTEKLDG